MHRRAPLSVPENIDAAIPVRQKEHIVVVVPRYLVHLKLELLLCP